MNFLERLLMLVFFPRRMRGLGSILLLLCARAGIDSLAGAATITWGTPQTISGDTDVVTTGSLVYAYNIGPAGVGATSVNGVSFAAFAFPSFSDFQQTASNANVSFVESPGTLVSFSNLRSVSTPYSGLRFGELVSPTFLQRDCL